MKRIIKGDIIEMLNNGQIHIAFYLANSDPNDEVVGLSKHFENEFPILRVGNRHAIKQIRHWKTHVMMNIIAYPIKCINYTWKHSSYVDMAVFEKEFKKMLNTINYYYGEKVFDKVIGYPFLGNNCNVDSSGEIDKFVSDHLLLHNTVKILY